MDCSEKVSLANDVCLLYEEDSVFYYQKGDSFAIAVNEIGNFILTHAKGQCIDTIISRLLDSLDPKLLPTISRDTIKNECVMYISDLLESEILLIS